MAYTKIWKTKEKSEYRDDTSWSTNGGLFYFIRLSIQQNWYSHLSWTWFGDKRLVEKLFIFFFFLKQTLSLLQEMIHVSTNSNILKDCVRSYSKSHAINSVLTYSDSFNTLHRRDYLKHVVGFQKGFLALRLTNRQLVQQICSLTHC